MSEKPPQLNNLNQENDFDIEKEQTALEQRLKGQIEAIDFAQALSRGSDKRTGGVFNENQNEFLNDIKAEFLRFLDLEEAQAWLPKINEGKEIDGLVESFSKLIKYYLREWPLQEVEAYFNLQNTQDLFKGFLIYYAGNIVADFDYTKNYGNVLEVASKTHFHDPERIKKIKEKDPNVTDWIIQRFLFGNARDPGKAISNVLNVVKKLKI